MSHSLCYLLYLWPRPIVSLWYLASNLQWETECELCGVEEQFTFPWHHFVVECLKQFTFPCDILSCVPDKAQFSKWLVIFSCTICVQSFHLVFSWLHFLEDLCNKFAYFTFLLGKSTPTEPVPFANFEKSVIWVNQQLSHVTWHHVLIGLLLSFANFCHLLIF
jgi:hypothetical protein